MPLVHHPVHLARTFDGRPFTALQVIVPDANGRWPEDPAYDGTPQPLLGAA